VLAEVALRLRSDLRIYDVVGRYGGEEFILLLPGCDLLTASRRADQIRCTVESTRFSVRRGRHTNTVMELPDEVRDGKAIPGAIAEILRQIEEGRSLEDMRKQGILEIGGWRIDILY
jgi:PleD family two-component response regulator